MQISAIQNKSTTTIQAASVAQQQDATAEFSELLNSMDTSGEGSGSRGQYDAEMIDILSAQLSSDMISRATAQQINQKAEKQEKLEDKDAAEIQQSEDSDARELVQAVAEKVEAKTTSLDSNQGKKVKRDRDSQEEEAAVDSQADAKKQLKSAFEGKANREGVDLSKIEVSNTTRSNSSSSASAQSNFSSIIPEQGLAKAQEGELSAADMAVRNMFNAPQLEGSKANTAPRVEAPILPIAEQMIKNAIQDSKAAKITPQISIEGIKTDVAVKSKEIAPQREELRSAKAPLKKDFQQAVQRIEDALKEAIAAKDGKSVSLRLDPPSLGSVKVDVTLREGTLYARIVAESPQVGNMMRERSHDIVESLRKLGLNIDSVNVFIGNGGQGGEFKEQLATPSKGNAQALRTLLNDTSNLDPKSLAPDLVSGSGLETGWIA